MKVKNTHNTSNMKQRDNRKTPKIIGLGIIKLDFYININDDLIKTHKIDLAKINNPKDLLFISESPELLDLVQISTTDTLINILLYLNKANIQKSFVELITLNALRFKPEEEHIRKIFSYVTEHNYLFTNEMSVATVPNKLSFAIKSGKKLLKYFDICADYDPFAEEFKKEEINLNAIEASSKVITAANADKSLKDSSDIKIHDEKINISKNLIINNENNFDNFTNHENSKNLDDNLNINLNNEADINNQVHNQSENKEDSKLMGEKRENADNYEQHSDSKNHNRNHLEKNDNVEADANNNEFQLEEIKEPENVEMDNNNNEIITNANDIDNAEALKLDNQRVTENKSKNKNFENSNEINLSKENNDDKSHYKNDKINESYDNNNKPLSSQKNIEKNLNNSANNLEVSRTNNSMYKLFNIPAACEIEEYDYIFLNLDEFLILHGSGLHLIELADFIKKIALANKTPHIVINFPNILLNINIVNLELIDIILSIMSYTDIFLFDKRECLAFFNMLSQMNADKELTEKNLFEHFQREIPHIKTGVNKIGLFIEDLQKFNIVEQKADKLINNNEYYLNLHPKINHTNQQVIQDYRKIMMLNNNYFKAIFFGGFFSKYIFLEDHYPSFISGIESTKRILELFKHKIDFPSHPEFYVVKLQKAKITKDLTIDTLRKKEEKFVLDCINKKSSSIKHYNPLFDNNLNAFFASSVVRKQLKERGFINTNGFVLYDPSYKNIVLPKQVKKRVDTQEKEKHLLYAIKNNKDIFSTDLESYSKSLKDNSPTTRRLPNPNLLIKDSSNLYISNKLYNLKKSQKRLLKPLYYSVNKRDRNEKSQDASNDDMKKNNITNNSNSKSATKITNKITSKQNYHNLNKSHINNLLNSSNLKDDKINVSKIENVYNNNSIIDMSILKQNITDNKNNETNLNIDNTAMENLMNNMDFNEINENKNLENLENKENDKSDFNENNNEDFNTEKAEQGINEVVEEKIKENIALNPDAENKISEGDLDKDELLAEKLE